MSETVPFDQWISKRESARAGSSPLGRSFFEMPMESRAPTEEEQRDARFATVAEAARETGQRCRGKNWRRRRKG